MARVHVHIRPTEALHSSVHATPSGLTIDLLESNNALPTAYWWRCRVEGLMQDYELTLQHVLWRLERLHSRSEIVTRRENGNHRTTNGEMVRRVNRLAGGLERPRVKHAHPPATPRASCTRTARSSSTRWASCRRTTSASARTTWCCRSCRCSTPTAGACRTRSAWPARSASSLTGGWAMRRRWWSSPTRRERPC